MRPTQIVTCTYCGKDVEKFVKDVAARLKLDADAKFYCNRVCAASRRKELVACGTCGAPLELSDSRRKKSHGGPSFCNRSCAAITNNTLRDRRGYKHPKYVNGGTTYRQNWLKERCEECGDSRIYLLVVHHKNGNRKENSEGNLETLCPSCHATRHLVVRNGRLVVLWNTLTTEEARVMLNDMATSSKEGCFPV